MRLARFFAIFASIVKHGERRGCPCRRLATFAASYLKFKNSKNEDGRPPQSGLTHRASRAAATHGGCAGGLQRAAALLRVHRRRPGKSEEEGGATLILRRFLIPHFNLTFSTRDSLGLEAEAVELLLMAPNEFETRMRLKAIPKDDDGGDGGGGTAVDQMAFPFGDEGI